jgi:hypothetical protein
MTPKATKPAQSGKNVQVRLNDDMIEWVERDDNRSASIRSAIALQMALAEVDLGSLSDETVELVKVGRDSILAAIQQHEAWTLVDVEDKPAKDEPRLVAISRRAGFFGRIFVGKSQ